MIRRTSIFVLVFLASWTMQAQAYVLGPTNPGKWGPPTLGTGANVTWSLMANGVSCAAENAGCTISALPAAFVPQIQAAFDAWEAVANINFTQVADSNAAYNAPGATGDIRIGMHAFDGAFGVLAHGYYPPNNGSSAAGDVHFDSAENWNTTQDASPSTIWIFMVALHEIGHAIGLNHTNVPNSVMNAFYNESLTGLQADDIAGAQALYGLPQAVPVPAAIWLMASGLGVLAAARRRTASSV